MTSGSGPWRRSTRPSQPVEWLLLNAEANVEVDLTAADALGQLHDELERRGIVLALARVKQDLQRAARAHRAHHPHRPGAHLRHAAGRPGGLRAPRRGDGRRRCRADGRRPDRTADKVEAGSRRNRPRCCPGEGVRRNGHFCHAPKASITSAAPTTLTLPTHDLDAGAAADLTATDILPRDGAISKGFWHALRCKFLNLRCTGLAARTEAGQSSWIVMPVMATGASGRSLLLRGAETIRSTTSRPLVTSPNNV